MYATPCTYSSSRMNPSRRALVGIMACMPSVRPESSQRDIQTPIRSGFARSQLPHSWSTSISARASAHASGPTYSSVRVRALFPMRGGSCCSVRRRSCRASMARHRFGSSASMWWFHRMSCSESRMHRMRRSRSRARGCTASSRSSPLEKAASAWHWDDTSSHCTAFTGQQHSSRSRTHWGLAPTSSSSSWSAAVGFARVPDGFGRGVPSMPLWTGAGYPSRSYSAHRKSKCTAASWDSASLKKACSNGRARAVGSPLCTRSASARRMQ